MRKTEKKYVTFSRKTAKRNPHMILREYNHLLDNHEEYKENLKNTLQIKVNLSSIDENDLKNLRDEIDKNLSNRNTEHIVDLPHEIGAGLVESSEVIKSKNKEISRIEKQMHEISKEREIFMAKYITNKTLDI